MKFELGTNNCGYTEYDIPASEVGISYDELTIWRAEADCPALEIKIGDEFAIESYRGTPISFGGKRIIKNPMRTAALLESKSGDDLIEAEYCLRLNRDEKAAMSDEDSHIAVGVLPRSGAFYSWTKWGCDSWGSYSYFRFFAALPQPLLALGLDFLRKSNAITWGKRDEIEQLAAEAAADPEALRARLIAKEKAADDAWLAEEEEYRLEWDKIYAVRERAEKIVEKRMARVAQDSPRIREKMLLHALAELGEPEMVANAPKRPH